MVSAKARLKIVYPLIAVTVSAAIVLTLFFVGGPGYWLANPLGTLLLFGIIMACGATFAMLPLAFALRTENFLLGPRRTYWKLDQQTAIPAGESWTYPFHLPRNGWLGVRCDSNSYLTVDIAPESSSGIVEEIQRNVRNAKVTYRAGREGRWIVKVRNVSSEPANVHIRVSELVTSWD